MKRVQFYCKLPRKFFFSPSHFFHLTPTCHYPERSIASGARLWIFSQYQLEESETRTIQYPGKSKVSKRGEESEVAN